MSEQQVGRESLEPSRDAIPDASRELANGKARGNTEDEGRRLIAGSDEDAIPDASRELVIDTAGGSIADRSGRVDRWHRLRIQYSTQVGSWSTAQPEIGQPSEIGDRSLAEPNDAISDASRKFIIGSAGGSNVRLNCEIVTTKTPETPVPGVFVLSCSAIGYSLPRSG
jgi:hypothetical protein